MKHSSTDMKWFYRALLIILIVSMTYIAIKPNYNMAHWVPHSFLRAIGIPYQIILWSEQHIDKLLHFVGAGMLVLILTKARLTSISATISLFIVIALSIAIELVQLMIGRGFNSSDLLLGILGSFMAYSGIRKNKQLSN